MILDLFGYIVVFVAILLAMALVFLWGVENDLTLPQFIMGYWYLILLDGLLFYVGRQLM